MKADGRDRPVALDHKISEGVAISQKDDARIAWSNTHGQYPDSSAEGRVRDLHGGHRLRGRPAEACEQEGSAARQGARVHAGSAGLPQERHRADLHLLPVAVRRRLRRRISTRKPSRPTGSLPASTTRSRGSSRMASTRWSSPAASRPKHNSNFIDIWKLKLEAEQPGFRADDAVGRLSRLQGVEPCGQSRWSLVCLPVRAEHRRRRRGVRHLPVQGSVADGAESAGPACRAAGPSRRLPRRPTHVSWPS